MDIPKAVFLKTQKFQKINQLHYTRTRNTENTVVLAHNMEVGQRNA